MYRLRTGIKITQQGEGRNGVFYFTKVNEVSIERSWDKMTQTAKVILPRNTKYKDRNVYEGENPLFRRGDKIELLAGYHPQLTSVFIGYISKINNNIPIEILCEDEMWKLKQTIAPNLSYQTVTLKKLLRDACGPNVLIKPITAQLGQIRLQGASVGKILQALRDDYGLYSFFEDTNLGPILYVGLAYYPDRANNYTFIFERDMIKDGMNLIYLKKDDVKVQVKGIIIKNDNTREEHVYGDTTGDIRTVFQYGGDKAQLDITCNSFLEQANYTGYFGDFLTFLEPKVLPGDYATIDSYKMPERNGKYLIKSVVTTFGVKGGRQKIELERKIA